MKFRRVLSIKITAMSIFQGFVYKATIFGFVKDRFGLGTSNVFLNALFFSFLAFLCLFSSFMSVVTDPGHIPPSYVPDVENNVASGQESNKPSYEVEQAEWLARKSGRSSRHSFKVGVHTNVTLIRVSEDAHMVIPLGDKPSQRWNELAYVTA